MPTVHLRCNKKTIVLPQQQSSTVASLIAELAELLVATQETAQNDVADLRLAIKSGTGWIDISESKETLGELKITDSTIVGFAFGSEDFSYDEYV